MSVNYKEKLFSGINGDKQNKIITNRSERALRHWKYHASKMVGNTKEKKKKKFHLLLPRK